MDYSIPAEHVPLLREVLESALRDLYDQISNADNPEFKRGLRQREDALRAILDKLGGSVATSA